MPGPSQLTQRRSGVLMHLTSLPGPRGSGDLGRESEAFVEFLADARQSWWQMLPAEPPGHAHSPYMTTSAFAVNPHLVDPEALRETGLLDRVDPPRDLPLSESRIDWAAVARWRDPLLRRAAEAFFESAGQPELSAFEAYWAREASWLEDFALFCALRTAHGNRPWTEWDPGVRDRRPDALARAHEVLRDEVRHHAFAQYVAAGQWGRLRERCHRRGIGLIGDLPIFVAHDSADVWANRERFRLDEQGAPEVVAGVPPDYFSETGQRWGHPLYRWDYLRERGFDWWMARFRRTFTLFDAVRIDHFIGFQRYWEIPASCPTAIDGHWEPGPSDSFFERLVAELGHPPIIAEDLGAVGEDVIALRERFGFPGMRVLQFAFGGDPSLNDHLPHRYPFRTVVYTGTHDNDTARGWFEDLGQRALPPRRAGRTPAGAPSAGRGGSEPSSGAASEAARREQEFALRYLGTDGSEIHWDLIRLAWSSVADLAIAPAQDLLGLGSDARMNRPADAEGNWSWRVRGGALDGRIAARLRDLTELYGRTAV